MARIVYGVSGEGAGHTSRALAILPHLIEKGHDVKVVGYRQSYQDLKDLFDVYEAEGPTFGMRENAVSISKTISQNLAMLPGGYRRSVELKEKLFKKFKPHAVVTDFEPNTAHLAGHYKVPLISLDNQHRMRYMKLAVPARLAPAMKLTRSVIQAMIPRPDVCLVTTFFHAPVTNDRTFVFPPLIRPEILDSRPKDGQHIIVYFTRSFDRFIRRLAEFPRERFLVYGQGKEGEEENLSFRPFSREGFVSDLAGCKAVMASAGFTLITESLHLGKPYLALPTRGQFEQELNAFMLDKAGYGKGCLRVRADTIGDFLYRLPQYRAAMADYTRSEDRQLHAKLDELLADNAALAREYQRKRSS